MSRRPEGRPPDLVGVTQAAALKGVTDAAVRHAIRAGRLPAIRIGSQWVIKRVNLDEWLPNPRFAGRKGRGGSKKEEG